MDFLRAELRRCYDIASAAQSRTNLARMEGRALGLCETYAYSHPERTEEIEKLYLEYCSMLDVLWSTMKY